MIDISDKGIYERLVKNAPEGTDIPDRVELLIAEGKRWHTLFGREKYLSYLGNRFRAVLEVSDDLSDKEVGEIFL